MAIDNDLQINVGQNSGDTVHLYWTPKSTVDVKAFSIYAVDAFADTLDPSNFQLIKTVTNVAARQTPYIGNVFSKISRTDDIVPVFASYTKDNYLFLKIATVDYSDSESDLADSPLRTLVPSDVKILYVRYTQQAPSTVFIDASLDADGGSDLIVDLGLRVRKLSFRNTGTDGAAISFGHGDISIDGSGGTFETDTDLKTFIFRSGSATGLQMSAEA